MGAAIELAGVRRYASDLVTAVTFVVDQPFTAGLRLDQIADELNERCDHVAGYFGIPASIVRAQVTKAVAMRAVLAGQTDVARAFLEHRGGDAARVALAEIQQTVARCRR